MSTTVSDQMLSLLADSGLKRLYGLTGDSMHALMESLEHETRVHWVQLRHEESAVFAAEAEAMLTGNLTVCCSASGPGNLHQINGLYDAHRNAAPVLAIATQLPMASMGGFQQVDLSQLYHECSHYCQLVLEPHQSILALQQAQQHAVERGGVSVLILPSDVAESKGISSSEGHVTPPYQRWGHGCVAPAQRAVEQLAAMLDKASRVTFFCGRGCAEAREDVIALAQRLKAPIAYSFRAKESMEYHNPLAIGMSGLLGWGDATHAMHDCDLLVLWGTDFPYSSFLPDGVPIVQIDRCAERLGSRIAIQLGVEGDIGLIAQQLLEMVSDNRCDIHLTRSLTRHHKLVKRQHNVLREAPSLPTLRPEYLTRLISDNAAPDAIFTIDTGSPLVWAARYLQADKGRRFLASYWQGSMGCALPMAIGAKISHPEREVMALCGDASLSMIAGDLLTLLREELGVKVFVYNNSSLDFLKLQQHARGMSPMGTDLYSCDYSAMARGMGVAGLHLNHVQHAAERVREWLQHDGPAVLDATIASNALVQPPDLSFIRAMGFAQALYEPRLRPDLAVAKRLLFAQRDIYQEKDEETAQRGRTDSSSLTP